MKYKIYKIIFTLIVFIFIPHLIFGAEFVFGPEIKNININDEFKIDLKIDTKSENANAVEGTFIYPKDLLQIKEINDGNSIINFWIKKPTDTDKGIVFSGVTPGGHVGSEGQLFSVIFMAKSKGNGDLKIENGKVLRNDGLGSLITLKESSLNFSINETSSKTQTTVQQLNDINPPELFTPQISSDPNLLDGKWFLVFYAEDKGTGIMSYEVKESKYNLLNFSKWIPAESPYVLKDQTLKSYIFVKAIDKAGNETVVKLSPRNPVPIYANIENWLLVISIIVVASIYLFVSRKFKKIV